MRLIIWFSMVSRDAIGVGRLCALFVERLLDNRNFYATANRGTRKRKSVALKTRVYIDLQQKSFWHTSCILIAHDNSGRGKPRRRGQLLRTKIVPNDFIRLRCKNAD